MKGVSSQHAKVYFFEIPVVYQLSVFFSQNGFYSDIQYCFHRTKKHPENVEEIYDGALYKKYYRPEREDCYRALKRFNFL